MRRSGTATRVPHTHTTLALTLAMPMPEFPNHFPSTIDGPKGPEVACIPTEWKRTVEGCSKISRRAPRLIDPMTVLAPAHYAPATKSSSAAPLDLEIPLSNYPTFRPRWPQLSQPSVVRADRAGTFGKPRMVSVIGNNGVYYALRVCRWKWSKMYNTVCVILLDWL